MTRFTLMLLICGVVMAEDAGSSLYLARLASDPARQVAIEKLGNDLVIEIRGLSARLRLPVTRSSAELCVVWLKSESKNARVSIHLPILDRAATCRPLPPGITAEIAEPHVSWHDEDLLKISGKDRTLRKLVESGLGRVR